MEYSKLLQTVFVSGAACTGSCLFNSFASTLMFMVCIPWFVGCQFQPVRVEHQDDGDEELLQRCLCRTRHGASSRGGLLALLQAGDQAGFRLLHTGQKYAQGLVRFCSVSDPNRIMVLREKNFRFTSAYTCC